MKGRLRIAILDSGVFVNHPHIRSSIAGGVTITPEGQTDGFRDNLGHGTAICALLQQLAPDADIFAVKIFESRLATSLAIVLNAIDWCLQQRINIINLSLGTANHDHLSHFAAAVERAHNHGTVVVSAYQANETPMLPGSLPTVIGVAEDPSCPRQSTRFIALPTPHVAACPYPLDIDGIPRERNLRGVSFSVAHVTAHIARLWHASVPDLSADADWLARLAADQPARQNQLL
ncbi:S8 family serine peptidase [Edaphobacter modestus]|uniref:Subtilase family protein n=1 Tax=Edaphobacter modestus TaxID=388466 RepID=A0A4Q7YQF9_9BACT|nr:S8 family serine peptidase [Edaphobacter modestus]RZU38985.1 subtilase family protein [Edaphobacter modestus]